MAHHTSFLYRHRDVIASFLFGAWSVQTCFTEKKYFRVFSTNCELNKLYFIQPLFTPIMSSPGQKRGTCGHIMALFDSHKKFTICREKGMGDDPCVKKMDCQICKVFKPVQIQQLSTPTYKSRKECEQKNVVNDSPTSATPTLMDPSEVTLLGRVHNERAASVESTPAGKKKKRSYDSSQAQQQEEIQPQTPVG